MSTLRESLRTRALNYLSGGDYGQQQAAIRESLSTLIDRTSEDQSWRLLALDQPFAAPGDPTTIREQSRLAFAADPYAKRSALLTTAHAFGGGVDGPTAPDGDPGADVLNEFWRDDRNQSTMFGTLAQHLRSNQLQVDGELLVLVYGATSPVQVRRLGPAYLQEAITDPEDSSRILYYRVEYPVRTFDEKQGGLRSDGTTRRVYYPDLMNREAADDPVLEHLPEGQVAPDTYLLQVPLNSIVDGGRGIPDSAASLRYLARLKGITEDQATISRATAALMNRIYVDGNPDQVNAIASHFRGSSTVTGDDSTHHAPPLPGAANVMNRKVQLEQSRASTNASDARTNSRLMKMAAAAGFGWSLHYLGDPENANLATATSMEGPQLKTMLAYQALWIWIYRSLCNFVLWKAEVEGSRYDVPMPAIVQHPLRDVAAAALDAADAGKIRSRVASQLIMAALGMDNLEMELEALEAEAEETASSSPAVTVADLEQAFAALATAAAPAAGGDEE